MSSSSTRNNILAGSFLLISVALGVVASFVLSDVSDRLKPMNEYIVRFSLAEGASGIKAGSPVLLGGQPVGKVVRAKIEPQPVAASRPSNPGAMLPAGIDVYIRVSADFTLYDNAQFFLELPLLGSLTSININSMGGRETVLPELQVGTGPELASMERVQGHIAPPSFLAQAGVGTEQVLDIKEMIAQAKDVMGKINTLIDKNADLVTQTLTDARGAAGEARSAVKQVSDKMPAWTERVDSVLASADETVKGGPALRDSARGLLDDSRGLVTDARGILTDNRPKINEIIDNVNHASGVLSDNLDPLATQARQSMASFESLSTRLDTIVSTEGPEIRRTLSNTRLATDQLKLAILEIRAQPWRLLVQPDTKELQEQLLYDSARSYAAAVSDLRAASESLETMVGPGAPPDAADAAQIAERMNELEGAFAKYREAEKKLFEQLGKTAR